METIISFVQLAVTVVCHNTLEDIQAVKDLLKEIDWFCQISRNHANRKVSQDRRRDRAKIIYRNILAGNGVSEFKLDLTDENGPAATMQIAGSKGKVYTVVATQGGVTCSCPDSWDHEQLCKHKMAMAGVLRAHLPQVASHLACQFVTPVAKKAKAKSQAA